MLGHQILDLMFHSWKTNVIFTANRLRLFAHVAGEGKTAETLATEMSVIPRYLKVLLNACVGMGLLVQRDGRYSLSHAGEAHLVEGRPQYLGDIIEVLAREVVHWERLHDLITTGQSGAEPEAHSVEQGLFTRAMNNLGMLEEATALAYAVDLQGCKTLIDVGGGSGLYSITFCQHYPDLQATVVDQQKALKITKQYIDEKQLTDRVVTRVADIFQDGYGENADVVLLSDVLYRTTDLCRNMLRHAFDALVPGGKLVIRGYLPALDGGQPEFAALFAVHTMLSEPDSEPITTDVLQRWITESGFLDIRQLALTTRSTCLTAQKPA